MQTLSVRSCNSDQTYPSGGYGCDHQARSARYAVVMRRWHYGTDGGVAHGLVYETTKACSPVYETPPRFIRPSLGGNRTRPSPVLQPIFLKPDIGDLQKLNGRIQVGWLTRRRRRVITPSPKPGCSTYPRTSNLARPSARFCAGSVCDPVGAQHLLAPFMTLPEPHLSAPTPSGSVSWPDRQRLSGQSCLGFRPRVAAGL